MFSPRARRWLMTQPGRGVLRVGTNQRLNPAILHVSAQVVALRAEHLRVAPEAFH